MKTPQKELPQHIDINVPIIAKAEKIILIT